MSFWFTAINNIHSYIQFCSSYFIGIWNFKSAERLSVPPKRRYPLIPWWGHHTQSQHACTIQSHQQQLPFRQIYVHNTVRVCIINGTKRAPSFSFFARWKPEPRLLQLTFISKEMEGKKHPFLYLTHCAAPLAHRRCANEYFNESKWILLLSQRCWHPLRSYRWSISARHAPVAW